MKRVMLYAAMAALLLTFVAAQSPNTAKSSPATAAAVKPAVKHIKPLGTAAPVVMLPPGTITATVSAWVLPLRDGPSRKGKILTELRHNTLLTVIGVNRFHTWIKVNLTTEQAGVPQPQPDNVQTGWVSVYYVFVKGGLLRSVPVMDQ